MVEVTTHHDKHFLPLKLDIYCPFGTQSTSGDFLSCLSSSCLLIRKQGKKHFADT